MLKNYDVTSWAAFIDRFGYPIRLGKYGAKATEEDIKTLRRAVSAIGSDFGAIIPESADIQITRLCTGSKGEALTVKDADNITVGTQSVKLLAL